MIRKYFLHLLFALILALAAFSFSAFASILPGSSDTILRQPSIEVDVGGNNVSEVGLSFGMKILSGVKLLISGFALIYIVLIGVFMIIFSENEERIKSQRKQFTYTLVGFLFLNMPSLVYSIFYGPDLGAPTSRPSIGLGEDIAFWDSSTLLGSSGFIPMIIGFFEIFIFGVAVVMFTWGFFRLILSGGDEEVQKKAKGRVIYGLLGLIFLGFVKLWGGLISGGDFFGEFANVGKSLMGLALYFAAPVVIFFLVLAAYYYIASGGDEERVKKGKNIFINTLIASLILLGAYAFLMDLASFSL